MALSRVARFPFLSRDAWLTDSLFNPASAGKKAVADRSYDWGRLQNLLYRLPVKSGNLRSLSAAADGWLYWLDDGPTGDGCGVEPFSLKIKEKQKYYALRDGKGEG